LAAAVWRGTGTGLALVGGGLLRAYLTALKGTLSSTQGYAAMWLVCSLSILASIPLVGQVGEE
jgi:hypothetical protein